MTARGTSWMPASEVSSTLPGDPSPQRPAKALRRRVKRPVRNAQGSGHIARVGCRRREDARRHTPRAGRPLRSSRGTPAERTAPPGRRDGRNDHAPKDHHETGPRRGDAPGSVPAAGGGAGARSHGRSGAAMYQVKIENLTANQLFSPPMFISHDASYRLLPAPQVRQQRGGPDRRDGRHRARPPCVQRTRAVCSTCRPPRGRLPPGESVTVTVRSPRWARLSLATMLVQTNDGFVGVNGLRLKGLSARSFNLRALDAGTEANNEMAAYVPGPPFGGTMRDPTHQRIRYSTRASRASPTSTRRPTAGQVPSRG